MVLKKLIGGYGIVMSTLPVESEDKPIQTNFVFKSRIFYVPVQVGLNIEAADDGYLNRITKPT